MLVSQKPCTLTAGKVYVLGLENFAAVKYFSFNKSVRKCCYFFFNFKFKNYFTVSKLSDFEVIHVLFYRIVINYVNLRKK